MFVAFTGFERPDAFQKPLGVLRRSQQVKRFLDRIPLALRDDDHALGIAPRDRDRRAVGDCTVHYRLQIGAGIGEAERSHASKLPA